MRENRHPGLGLAVVGVVGRRSPGWISVTSALEESAAAFSEKQQIHSKLFSERVVMMNCGRC